MTGGISISKAAALALSLFALFAVPAFGAQGTTPSGLIQDVLVFHDPADAGQPVDVDIQIHLARADLGPLTPITQIVMTLPVGMTRNYGAFPACDPAALRALGPRGCPDGSRIGTGLVIGDARPVVTDPIFARVTIFNGPGGSVLLYVFPDLGPTYVIEGRPVGATTIVFDIPPIPTLPGAPYASIREFRLHFLSTFLVNPPYCPPAGWTWGFDLTYANGEQLSVPVNVPCTGPPPPVEANRSVACKAERDRLGETAFAARYGTNRSGRNALGKCVSGSGALSF